MYFSFPQMRVAAGGDGLLPALPPPRGGAAPPPPRLLPPLPAPPAPRGTPFHRHGGCIL